MRFSPIRLSGWRIAPASFSILVAFTFPTLAQDVPAQPEPGVSPEVAFILNTLLFLIGGFLVMWMAAGFAMLEAGMVRSKNVSTQLLKNIANFSVAGLAYWAVGYSLMYVHVNGWIGTPAPYSWPSAGSVNTGDYAVASDWFFQMVFVATAASIVSGTIAERVKFWPFLIFAGLLAAFVYPIAGSWHWGGGWLSDLGFADFAGSTLVHSVGGWAALAGAIVIGPRLGKYAPDGAVLPIPGSNMALATLGTFILWFGWFGFNGASQLSMGSNVDASDIARIFANTNLAAAGGCIAAIIGSQIIYRKIDITFALNGALAGLVSITAEPLMPSAPLAIAIGSIGGILVIFAIPLLDRFRIDDVVGAIPVHLVCGIYGTLAVPLSNPEASVRVQLIGVFAYGAFTFAVSLCLWTAIRTLMGLRVSPEVERNGLDLTEIGVEAYPEFASEKGV